MPITLQVVRKYPLSLACILLIWILSLTPFFPETPLDNVDFIDKWTHLVMYGGTSVTCAVISHRRFVRYSFLWWR